MIASRSSLTAVPTEIVFDSASSWDAGRELDSAWDIGSPYVPLMPDAGLMLHAAHESVPAPAFTTVVPAEPNWYVPG